MSDLTLENLVAGLEIFSDRYQALDVFIADVAEIQALASGMSVPDLHPDDERSFLFWHGAAWYRLRLFPEDGVARLTRAERPPPNPNTVVGGATGAVVGGAIGALVAPERKTLEGAAAGLLLGLLVGAALGAAGAGASPARKVFALCYDPGLGQWRPYDGGLVRWMKAQLAPPSVLAGLRQ